MGNLSHTNSLSYTTSQISTASGQTLAINHWHKPDAETVLLLHGYPDSQRIWLPTAERLAKQFNVLSYDVRGAGFSQAPRLIRDYRFDCLAEDFIAVVKAKNDVKPVHLVGHDWGSIQGWEFIQRADTLPYIASFTSICGPSLDHAGLWLRQQWRQGEWRAIAKQVLRSWYVAAFHLPLLAPLAWRLGLAWIWPDILRRFEGITAAPDPQQCKNGRFGVNLYRANILRSLFAPKATRAKAPLQLVVAADDTFVAKELYAGIEDRVEKCLRQDLPAGHWLPISHAEWLADAVAKFIAAVTNDELEFS